MEATWTSLARELERWSEAGRTPTFWWRDDDAVAPSAELDRLLAVTGGVPLGLAVIPALAEPALAERLAERPEVGILQHGWRHANHARGGKPSEYPAHRAAAEVRAELEEGRRRMLALFGARALPVFVPAYHGFDDCFLPLLPAAGLSALSRKHARPWAAAGGLVQCNVHAVPIAWSPPPRFCGAATVLDALLQHLEGRRTGQCDAAEPTGILTHHLAQDAESYEFLTVLKQVIAAHGGQWLDIGTVFQVEQPRAPL
jgi:hypothetical protein